MSEHKRDHPRPESNHVESTQSGSYDPGPINPDDTSRKLSYVDAQQDDLLLEEFPDGPYGSSTSFKLGKSTPWKPGQRGISVFRDQNPVDSNRKVPLDEPSTDGHPRGSIEGQN